MSAERTNVRQGDVLAGKYRVERVLGRGGMGLVVEVVELASGAPRALKLLTQAALNQPTTVERFFREARATAKLTGEHVVRVHDVGMLASGAPYMAMELLVGADLGATLKRRGALPAHEAALYVMQACQALEEAHAAGIVHRDLKPANLFLTRRPDGSACVKVLDFGISKAMIQRDDDDVLTLTNAVLGSPAYMSPEQIRSARDVDPRTDLWSLGVVLYQLVTGALPFSSANSGELVGLVLRAEPKPPSSRRRGLPLALDAVILRCLEKDPAQRFADMAALAAALAPFVPAERGGPASPPARARRPRALLLALGVAAVVLAIGAALAVTR